MKTSCRQSCCRDLYCRLAKFVVILCAVLSVATSGPAFAQRVKGGDDYAVRQTKRGASGELIELYDDGVNVSPTFLITLENAYRKIEKLLGHPHDKATLGDKLQVHVSSLVPVSHVWRGYDHQQDPRGILLLNRGAYFGAMRGENATYAHELGHLFTWRFHSHTLCEGLADYIALEVLPGGVVGPNVKGYDWAGKLPDEVVELLGTTIAPPEWATSDPRRRQAYYFGSYLLCGHSSKKAACRSSCSCTPRAIPSRHS